MDRMKTYQEQEQERRQLIDSIKMTNDEIRAICNDRTQTWGQQAAQLTHCPKCHQTIGRPCLSREKQRIAGGRRSHPERTSRASAIIAQTIGWTS